MKKILCLLLCIAMMCLLLAACGNKSVGEYLEKYEEEELWKPEVKPVIELDMYIITGDATTENAIKTVERSISSYIEDKYSTVLDLHYVTADQYESVVKNAIDLDTEDRADIVLINSPELYKDVKDSLVDLSSYLKSSTYGTLKTRIAKSLLNAATDENGKLYCVPNNHVVGQYEYIIIDKDAAQYVNYSENKIAQIKDINSPEAQALCAAIDSTGVFDSADCVKTVMGMYEDAAVYESQGYYCNVSSVPTVDEEEVFQSAFAIVKDPSDGVAPAADEDNVVTYTDYYNRAMEVIYAFNTDVTLRNRLQYGNKGTNYTEVEKTLEDGSVVTYAEPFNTGSGVYHMDLIHTGDVFIAYYSESLSWSPENAVNGKRQNDNSIVYVAPALLPESGDTENSDS